MLAEARAEAETKEGALNSREPTEHQYEIAERALWAQERAYNFGYLPSFVHKGYFRAYYGQYLREAVARLPQTSEYLARALIELIELSAATAR